MCQVHPEGRALEQKDEAERHVSAEGARAFGGLRGAARTFAQNSLINVSRILVTGVIALILPAYLVHKLSVEMYSAWVLILQLGAFVAYLDFGIQSGISKYVAEHEARNDAEAAGVHASAGLALMSMACAGGVLLTLVLAWQVPRLFHDMPSSLYREVRLSLVYVGMSLSFGLLCSIYSAIFYGLQRYAAPTVILLTNRLLYAAVVLGAVAFHRGLIVMGALVAAVNTFTGLLQIEAWRRWASRIRIQLRGLDFSCMRKIFGYCSALAVWTVGMLCVSGLDLTIVGKYDFRQTGFYSVAVLPVSFVTAILGAALAPLMPSISALSVLRSPGELGEVLARVTRYTTAILLISGLPLMVSGYWILRVWVGPVYAQHSIGYLRILLLANILRNTCAPYASMLVATSNQRIAIAGVIAEAITNVIFSIYLAAHIGAIGVAYGTLIGSFVSVGAHFLFNMRFTITKIAIPRLRLFLCGVVRPSSIAAPTVLLVPLWWFSAVPAFDGKIWAVWGMSTLTAAWLVCLNGKERAALLESVNQRAKRLACSNQ